jgi:uncharacterized protein
MRSLKPLLLASLLILFCAPALSAQQTASASHVQAAEALFEVMDMEKSLKESAELILAQQQQNPALAQMADLMREFMQTHLRWEKLKPDYVKLYIELFTEAELREMRAFYQTPLGQKMLATAPLMGARSAEISQRHLQEHMPELVQRMMERSRQE